jgi:hypothetical protein
MSQRTTATQARRSHFEFALWATSLAKLPTVREIIERFAVSYETARAWRNDWLDARLDAVVGARHAKG